MTTLMLSLRTTAEVHRIAELLARYDLKAVAEVRALIAQRSKLLGMEQTNLNVMVDTPAPQRAVLAEAIGSAAVDAFDPKTEAVAMLERAQSTPAGSHASTAADIEERLKHRDNQTFVFWDGVLVICLGCHCICLSV